MFPSYIQKRNNNYHLRVRTPVDLLCIIPQAEIIKSLKTTSLRTAKESALPYIQGIRQTATLIRLKYITYEQAQDRLSDLLKWKTVPQNVTGGITGSLSPTMETHLLSGVITQYILDREREWTLKTRMENVGLFNLIVGLIGDVPIESINRNTARDFKNKLSKLPPNVSKLYPQHSPLEVLKRIDSGIIIVSATLSVKSINKHMSRLSSLMNYCIKERYRTDNPASGMTIKQRKRHDEERKAYDKGDIQNIIKHLPPKDDRPERYWIPLICMYSGMRLDEACQLYKSDIIKYQDIWCFDINDSKDKKLKNRGSNRVVPLHPKLIELGFLKYVSKCQESGRLWENLTQGKLCGYSNALGKWFQRFNRKYITNDPSKTFHSLRHSFADVLKQLLVEKSIVSELLGHFDGSETFGRYAKKYESKVLLTAVSLMEY